MRRSFAKKQRHIASQSILNGYFSQGSTNQTELQRELLRSMLIAIPPIDEQKSISSFIKKYKKKTKEKIKQAKSEIKLSKEYLDSLVYQVVTGKLEVKE